MDKKLDRLAEKILGSLKVRGATLDIFLLPDRKIAALKKHFFKKKTEPNVISFPEPQRFPHPETRKRHLGEIYLNRDILRRSPERAAPLVLHGLLHLLGYDHKRRADTKEMEKLEQKVLGSFNTPRGTMGGWTMRNVGVGRKNSTKISDVSRRPR